MNVWQRKIDDQRSVFQRVLPPKNALQTKRPVFYSPGEFTGRGSEAHLHKRKAEILRFRVKRELSSNLPPKRKNRPEDRSAENQENGRGRGIRTHDFLPPKQTRYRTALYPVVTFEKPFAGRIRLLLKKTSRHAWKSRLFSSLSLLPALPVTPSLGPFLQNIGEAEERPH